MYIIVQILNKFAADVTKVKNLVLDNDRNPDKVRILQWGAHYLLGVFRVISSENPIIILAFSQLLHTTLPFVLQS
jgi:hypothetical protein